MDADLASLILSQDSISRIFRSGPIPPIVGVRIIINGDKWNDLSGGIALCHLRKATVRNHPQLNVASWIPLDDIRHLPDLNQAPGIEVVMVPWPRSGCRSNTARFSRWWIWNNNSNIPVEGLQATLHLLCPSYFPTSAESVTCMGTSDNIQYWRTRGALAGLPIVKGAIICAQRALEDHYGSNDYETFSITETPTRNRIVHINSLTKVNWVTPPPHNYQKLDTVLAYLHGKAIGAQALQAHQKAVTALISSARAVPKSNVSGALVTGQFGSGRHTVVAMAMRGLQESATGAHLLELEFTPELLRNPKLILKTIEKRKSIKLLVVHLAFDEDAVVDVCGDARLLQSGLERVAWNAQCAIFVIGIAEGIALPPILLMGFDTIFPLRLPIGPIAIRNDLLLMGRAWAPKLLDAYNGENTPISEFDRKILDRYMDLLLRHSAMRIAEKLTELERWYLAGADTNQLPNPLLARERLDGHRNGCNAIVQSPKELGQLIRLDDIGALDEVKRILRERVLRPMRQPESYARLGLGPARGVLLYGPPGCAKTTLVRALSGEAGVVMMALDCATILSAYVGEAERALRETFASARLVSPAILFLDEIDALAPSRSSSERSTVSSRVLSTLLIEMDGVTASCPGVCIIGATNLPWALDSALLRPGRFDCLVHVPLPDQESRCRILEVTGKRVLSSGIDYELIATHASGLSGAALCDAVRQHVITARGQPELSASQHTVQLVEIVQSTSAKLSSSTSGQNRYEQFSKSVKV